MNSEQLAQALKITPAKAEEWLAPLQEAFDRFDINTVARQSAFIGQCAHESVNFTALAENLNYSADGLANTWPARFAIKGADGKPVKNEKGRYSPDEHACAIERQPEKIANSVYGGRMGNGPEESGDGWKYYGRGLIQLTGKVNYQAASDALGVDFVSSPELVSSPRYAALTAGWFWNMHGLNELADARDNTTITKRIQGGSLGLDDRLAKTDATFSVLSA